MNTCLICETLIEPFIDFGRMPIANGFLSPEEFAEEYFFNLRVGFCPECRMAQLTEQVERDKELAQGLDRPDTFTAFRKNVEHSRDKLMKQLRQLKKEGKRVVGYAATSKSTTVTNYCGITPDLVEFISDTTPIKQGKYSLGMHIPVRPYENFKSNYPDVALLFGWNHAEEITANERAFRSTGGRWLVYVPEVKVI